MSRSRRLSALLAVFCLALASCTGDDDADRPQPTTTTVTTTTTTSPEASDEQALHQLAEDWYEASDAIYRGDAEVDSARAFIGEEYFDSYAERYRQFVNEGKTARPDPQGRSKNEVESVEVDGDRGTVVQCITDGDLIVDAATNEVLDESVRSTRFQTEASRAEDGWRFTERTVVVEYPEEIECGTT